MFSMKILIVFAKYSLVEIPKIHYCLSENISSCVYPEWLNSYLETATQHIITTASLK